MSVNIRGARIQMLPGGSQKTAKAVEDQARLDELAADPAQGGKATPKTRREAEVGLELEKSGKLTPSIKQARSDRPGGVHRWCRDEVGHQIFRLAIPATQGRLLPPTRHGKDKIRAG